MVLEEPHLNAVIAHTAANVINTDSDAQRRLEFVFGKHTFFTNEKGLFIVEPTTDPERPNRTLVKRVRLANWVAPDFKFLKPINATTKAKKIEI